MSYISVNSKDTSLTLHINNWWWRAIGDGGRCRVGRRKE
jgi:hypothetical protein